MGCVSAASGMRSHAKRGILGSAVRPCIFGGSVEGVKEKQGVKVYLWSMIESFH